MSKRKQQPATPQETGIRIDKWLWAARFFKTRSIAKSAIEGGKVHCQGERVKVSKDVRIGMELTIQQGIDKKTVIVKALSDVRRSAPLAQQLYEETAESIARREQQAEQRKMATIFYMSERPTKKDRRDLERFQQHHFDDFHEDELDEDWDDDEYDEDEDDWDWQGKR